MNKLTPGASVLAGQMVVILPSKPSVVSSLSRKESGKEEISEFLKTVNPETEIPGGVECHIWFKKKYQTHVQSLSALAVSIFQLLSNIA